jgi:L-threonylcarbamoyladenylate synthase
VKTKIKRVTRRNIEKAVKLLNQDMVVAIPTETVYGLAANCFSDKAVMQIFSVKNRKMDNPLIVHVSPDYDITNLVTEINSTAKALIYSFWPGPLTLVFNSKNTVSKLVSCGLDTIAIRMPSDKNTIKILSNCPFPLAAPSANTSSRPSPTTATAVKEDLQGKIPLILNGGKCSVGIESTVVDVTTLTPKILRPGIITKENIDKVVKYHNKTQKFDFNRSPGTKYKHYSPSCEMVVIDYKSKVDINNFYNNLTKAGKNPVIFCLKQDKKRYKGKNTYCLGKDLDSLIKNFYSALRACEKKYNTILIQGLERTGKQASIMDRIDKSCGGNII